MSREAPTAPLSTSRRGTSGAWRSSTARSPPLRGRRGAPGGGGLGRSWASPSPTSTRPAATCCPAPTSAG
eukprot:8104375-Lingulodinium_polyedra.AAC.1